MVRWGGVLNRIGGQRLGGQVQERGATDRGFGSKQLGSSYWIRSHRNPQEVPLDSLYLGGECSKQRYDVNDWGKHSEHLGLLLRRVFQKRSKRGDRRESEEDLRLLVGDRDQLLEKRKRGGTS